MDTWEYTWEGQLGWFPGAGWLRAPYFRETWEMAMDEAREWALFASRRGISAGIRVIRLDRATGKVVGQ